jgi:hypothetical protein
VLNSTAIRALLTAKCAKIDGRGDWRRWDKSSIEQTGLAHESEVWRSIWSQAHSSLNVLPMFVVAKDGRVSVYALPATEAAAIEFLKGL